MQLIYMSWLTGERRITTMGLLRPASDRRRILFKEDIP
jgi:hypothetical protein